jgi:histidyl-tRNA synthetase
VGELRQLVALCSAGGVGTHLRLDPSLARGLSYYTGSIFEIRVPGFAGSLAGGGRYDDLIGMFLGERVPACGISLGLERILVVMADRHMFPQSLVGTHADVMVTIWNADGATDAIRLGSELRATGLRVDVYPDADKLGKQFKYASARAVRFVTVVGDDEAARGEVAVKDLTTGEQTSIARAQVAAFIKNGGATR